MKNKYIFIVAAAIIVAIGGFVVWKFVLTPKSEVEIEEEGITLPPVDESVEVEVIPRSDKRAVTLKIINIPDGTTSIEYEIQYITAKGLPKGAVGRIRVKSGQTSVESEEILFGTCSRNVCRYDEGVTEVDLVLRFNSEDGASIFQETYKL